MIPKIIHYCWFGGNSLPELAVKCINSWKRHCPNYEIKLWNEKNFNINIVPFTAQVAKAKKWGFIVDYIRAYAVYNYGGIYLDTDVELLKPLSEDMLRNVCFGGFENKKNINPGSIFAGIKGCTIAKELMDFYTTYNFMQENGKLNLTPSPKIFTKILLRHGLKQDNTYQELGEFTAYPTEYFCPIPLETRLLNITKNTYSIHHYVGSWLSDEELWRVEIRKKVSTKLGDNIFSKAIIVFLLVMKRIKTHGFFDTVKFCYQRYREA